MKFVAHVLASSSCYVFFNGAVEALFSNFTGNSSSSHSLVGDWIRDNNNLGRSFAQLNDWLCDSGEFRFTYIHTCRCYHSR